MARRIEALSVNRPSTARRSGLCELFSCPPCTDIVRKFRKFASITSIRKHDSELIHLQRLTSPEYDLDSKIARYFDKTEPFNTPNTPTSCTQNDESIKDKDWSTIDKEGISKDGGKATPERVPLAEKGNIQMSKTGDVIRPTGKEKGGHEHETSERVIETPKTSNLKGTPGKLKGGSQVIETPKTSNSKGSPGKVKEKHDAPESKIGTIKANNSKSNTGEAKTKNSKRGIDGKDKGTAAGTSTINKDAKSINEGKSPKTKHAAKPVDSERIKEHSTLDDIQNIATDSRLASDMTGSKSKKGLSDKTLSTVSRHDKKHSLKVPSDLMRKKVAEYLTANKKKTQKSTGASGNKREAQKAAEKRDASAVNVRQSSFDTMQLVEMDSESGDRTTDISVCPPHKEEGEEEIIIGNRMYKITKHEAVKQEKEEQTGEPHPTKSWSPPPERPLSSNKAKAQSSVMHAKDGVLRYQMSDQKYIKRGWTIMPKEIIMQKVPVFLMRPAGQKYDWLEMNRHRKVLVYPSGELLVNFDEDITRLFYKSGEMALELYNTEDGHGHRLVVYSTSKPTGRSQRCVLAVFDYSGKGVVYDHTGQIRLQYSQREGVVIDRSIGPHTHWRWHNLDDFHLETVVMEKLPRVIDPAILHYAKEDHHKAGRHPVPGEVVMKAIEAHKKLDHNFVKRYCPFQIKMKAVKINEYFSLKIFEQSSIILSFSDGRKDIKLNVGMVLDPSVVLSEELVEAGDVASGVEGPLECSRSVERLRGAVAGARAAERARRQRERRLNVTPSYIYQKNRERFKKSTVW
ncbi:uncharacterized protein LOC125241238 [Leguminivora glycinivorella]|uniref:uncharacterized protein LOC125241238 n=1 Tax=Leguminivora glycinivorella TaxID=1035111 RepID=UPI00200D13BB|nr:uncharacterized protein LOC125241238 [Leguminivora glycinivorella]